MSKQDSFESSPERWNIELHVTQKHLRSTDVLEPVAIVTALPFLLHSYIMNKMHVFSVLNYESVSVILCVCECE